jgi:hypothetical protein
MVAIAQGGRPISDERHSDVQSADIAVQRLVDAFNRYSPDDYSAIASD